MDLPAGAGTFESWKEDPPPAPWPRPPRLPIGSAGSQNMARRCARARRKNSSCEVNMGGPGTAREKPSEIAAVLNRRTDPFVAPAVRWRTHRPS